MVSTRSLGQNFLVDRNILGVIERAAGIDPADVVLEIGGGLGILSQRLAEHAGHLHVVEVDHRLVARLSDALSAYGNVTVHVGDALEIALGQLTPKPTKMVANLPYSIAATVILRSIDELPTVRQWVVMVQREVGERLAARPGTPAYGVPSVLAQLACEVTVLRPVARTVFSPVPNVDSVLVGARRVGPAADAELQALVKQAFAHRRKALAGSLALAPAAPRDTRERARSALIALGHPADARAERLSPQDFRELRRMLACADLRQVG